jgi:hypothetical protein
MTTLADFTTPDEVRAVLGVTPEELEDKTLAIPLYLRQLQFDLSDISDTLEADYLTVAALASRTTLQQRLYDVMQAYAPYFVAKELLTSLAVFSPRVITDGRATAERVTDPFQDVRDGVDAGLVALRQRLRDAALALGGVTKAFTSTFSYSVSAGLATDPVTGV